jgi:hypothetical protein
MKLTDVYVENISGNKNEQRLNFLFEGGKRATLCFHNDMTPKNVIETCIDFVDRMMVYLKDKYE